MMIFIMKKEFINFLFAFIAMLRKYFFIDRIFIDEIKISIFEL